MGRVKTQITKRVSLDLVKEHSDKLKKDFNENKKAISGIINIPSKKFRNIIAGYVTRLMRNKQE